MPEAAAGCLRELEGGREQTSVTGVAGRTSAISRLFATEPSRLTSPADNKLWEFGEVCCLCTAKSCAFSGRRGAWFR